jgi:hypothetical protein
MKHYNRIDIGKIDCDSIIEFANTKSNSIQFFYCDGEDVDGIENVVFTLDSSKIENNILKINFTIEYNYKYGLFGNTTNRKKLSDNKISISETDIEILFEKHNDKSQKYYYGHDILNGRDVLEIMISNYLNTIGKDNKEILKFNEEILNSKNNTEKTLEKFQVELELLYKKQDKLYYEAEDLREQIENLRNKKETIESELENIKQKLW